MVTRIAPVLHGRDTHGGVETIELRGQAAGGLPRRGMLESEERGAVFHFILIARAPGCCCSRSRDRLCRLMHGRGEPFGYYFTETL